MTVEAPSNERLRAYLLGNVTAEEQASIAAYLERHPEELARLGELERASDSLVDDLRTPPDVNWRRKQVYVPTSGTRFSIFSIPRGVRAKVCESF